MSKEGGRLVAMTQPRLAHATDYGRMYSRKIGGSPEVPSITTVIGQEPKDMTGWAGHMATSELANDQRLAAAVGSPAELKRLARQASSAAERFRDAAAARGDRVHNYAEQVALRALGQPDSASAARALLAEHHESKFADRFDEWWELYDVTPLAAEVTVWNHTLGYAGTLDLIAEIGGRTCIIDFKTKGLTRDGRSKPLNDSVVMQLVAGMQAEELLVNATSGEWAPWTYGQDSLLLAVAVSEAEVVAVQANPAILKSHWHKFWALRQVWEHSRITATAGTALRPIAPPVASPGQQPPTPPMS